METLLALIMFYQVNLYRLQNGMQFVVEDKAACKLAEVRLVDMKTDYSHNGLHKAIDNFPVGNTEFYENLGESKEKTKPLGQKWILENWEKSKTHKVNLLQKMDGVCFRTDGRYWVMEGVDYNFK